MSSSSFLDERDNVFLNFTIFQRETNLLTRLVTMSAPIILIGKFVSYSVVTNAHSRRNVCVRPKTALGEVDPFLFEILKFLIVD